jgi:hypothetical protein
MEPHFKRSVAEKSDEIDRTSDNHVVLRTSWRKLQYWSWKREEWSRMGDYMQFLKSQNYRAWHGLSGRVSA